MHNQEKARARPSLDDSLLDVLKEGRALLTQHAGAGQRMASAQGIGRVVHSEYHGWVSGVTSSQQPAADWGKRRDSGSSSAGTQTLVEETDTVVKPAPATPVPNASGDTVAPSLGDQTDTSLLL